MSTIKKYANQPITYSSGDKLLETKLFQDIAREVKDIAQSKRRTGLAGVHKILAEKKPK
jgi:hypothetical protein